VIGDASRGGPARARNRLLAAARCPWVHFHDADDRVRPRFVEAFQEQLRAPPSADAWFCAAHRTQPGTDWEDELRYSQVGPDTDWIAYHLTHFLSHIQVVFPREFLMTDGGYDERLVSGEDVNLHIQLAARGMRFHYIDEILVDQVCARPGSLTSTTGLPRRLSDTLLSCEKLHAVLPARYRSFQAACVTDLAVHFCSLQMRPEMERAVDLALRSSAPQPPSPSRAMIRLFSHLLGFTATCQMRFRMIALRNALLRFAGRSRGVPPDSF